MNDKVSERLCKLVDGAFAEMGYDKYFTADQIYDQIKKHENDVEMPDVKYYMDFSADYKAKEDEKNGITKYAKVKRPSIVLVGNSPNLIERYNAGAEWSRLLKSLEDICVPYLGNTRRLDSFPLRMQAVCNLYNLRDMMGPSENAPIVEDLNNWFNSVADLRPTPIHRMLAEMEFDYYLTTNYDYAFEQLLYPDFFKNHKRESSSGVDFIPPFLKSENNKVSQDENNGVSQDENRVIHIHGSIDDIKNIVMLPRSFVEATKSLKRDKQSLWLEKFCESEVHICGLNLRPEETVVWYALEERLKYLHEKKERIISSYPRAYVYLFFNETDDEERKDYHDKCAMRDLLRTYAVNTILIPVRNNDYIQAWKLLVGEMMLAKNGCRLQYEQIDRNADDEDETDKLNDELEKALRKTEYGGGRLASLRTNMSTAFVAHYMYPYHCWISMSPTKANLVKKSGIWLCYCKIDSVRHMYYFPATAGISSCLDLEKGDKKQFLLDYCSGKLYEIQDDGNLKKVAIGHEIVCLDQFCRMIYSAPKNEE